MAKSGKNNQRKSSKQSRERALNAFDTAVYDDFYIKGLRKQQDIDLDHIADDRIRELMSNQVNSEDDEDIDSDEAMGSASDISSGEPDSDEDKWGESYDEADSRPLSEIWDLDEKDDETKSLRSKTAGKATAESANMDSSSNVSESDPNHSDSSGSSDEADMEPALSDSEDSSSQIDDESDQEASEALRKAVKSVGGHKDLGVSNNKLIEAESENPFAIPRASTEETLSLEDLGAGPSKAKPLSIPAPKRVQERADRGAAYQLAKKEVDKWADTVSANRQAEHLQFPIDGSKEDRKEASPFILSDEKERNDLEKKVASILETSQLADEHAASTFEEMAAAKLSIEDVRKRRDQLRYMRELMFREEQRAKRIKKIKSKKYRKIHKKERERMAQLENSDDENDVDHIEKAEKARASERATSRHKNNSKWAKEMSEHGHTRDSATRADIEEMLRQGDELRQKIRGNDNEYSEDEYADNFDEENMRLEEEANEKSSQKGVLGMKFMRDADERHREANRKAMRDDYDSDSEEENIGRKSYNPAGQQLKRDLAKMQEINGSDDDHHPTNKLSKSATHKKRLGRGDEIIEFKQSEDSGHYPKNLRPLFIATDNETAETTENPWVKASVNSTTPGMLKLAPSQKDRADKTHNKAKKAQDTITVENTFGDRLVREKDMTLKQQDLVRQAFAGDDVVAEFQAEKKAEIDEDKDQEVDETLPGWGSWSNEKPRVQKVRKIAGINETQRRDYKKANVIINEKVNKKTSKYNASAVPFPFENRQQYERSLRMPVGQEWVTKDTFQRQTKPRVLVKRGTIIDPIKKSH